MPGEMVEAVMVLCTAPSADVAAAVARALLDAHAAACVNVVPGLRSLYRWKGALQDDAEVQMVVKTVRARLPVVERIIKTHHPYETPEIIALPVVWGSSEYLAWIESETT